jgi:hypothetical protein
MKKQEHYFVLSCLVIVIGLLLFFRWRNNCKDIIKWQPLEIGNIVENFTPPSNIPTFKATSSYANIVVADDEGNLTTTSLNNAVADGLSTNTLTVKDSLKIKDWTISQSDNKLCFARSDMDKKICFTADVQSNESGKLNDGSGISFGDQEINETKWKKIDNFKKFAGWAINGDGTTFLIYEGSYCLVDGWGNAYTNDNWDIIYVHRGWEIQLWRDCGGSNGEGSGSTTTCKNTTDDMPKRCPLEGLQNNVSFVKATWVGY